MSIYAKKMIAYLSSFALELQTAVSMNVVVVVSGRQVHLNILHRVLHTFYSPETIRVATDDPAMSE